MRNSRESRIFQRAWVVPVGSVKGIEMIQQIFTKPKKGLRRSPGSFLDVSGRTGESAGKGEYGYNLAQLLHNLRSKIDDFVKAGMPGCTVKNFGSNAADGVFTMPLKADFSTARQFLAGAGSPHGIRSTGERGSLC
jgi:hypothetical protein